MAQYRVPDPEDLIECPYDKVHMVRAKRFQYHLMKCRNNYVGKDYATCPFNATHEMPRPELRFHLTNCPDKTRLEPELKYAARKETTEGSYFKGCTDIPAYNNFQVPSSEDWEREASGEVRMGIDPAFYSRVKFKDLSGMTRKEKKLMKDPSLTTEEKIKNLMANNDIAREEEQKLRLPKTSSIAASSGLQPSAHKLQQPASTIFAYSIGTGQSAMKSGAGRGVIQENTLPILPYGRGRGITVGGEPVRPVGVGRGMVVPPPGFAGSIPQA